MNTEVENETTDADEKARRLELSVQVKETNACERHVTVSVPAQDVERYFQDKFDDLAPDAAVPGFRAGKAPRKLIENRFRAEIKDQVKSSLLMDSLAQVNEESDFSAISEPRFDIESIVVPEDGPLTYEFDIEVRPEFDLPKWKGLKIEKAELEITDEDIDGELQKFGARFADLEPVEEAAQDGDHVVVNLTSKFEGKVVNQATEVLVELKPKLSFGDATFEDFGTLIVGAKSGDTKSGKVTVSEFADNERFARQRAGA